MMEFTDSDVSTKIKRSFSETGIPITDISIRRFPGEIIVVVEVPPERFEEAVSFASRLDPEVPGGFITVRKSSQPTQPSAPRGKVDSLADLRVNALVELLNSRSRTSEYQPSLKYVIDAVQAITVVVSKRHHLIFGRRGVGKTALMLEAKSIAETRGANTFWLNIQVVRSLNSYEAFLTFAHRLCELPSQVHSLRVRKPESVAKAEDIKSRIATILAGGRVSKSVVHRLLPEIQDALKRLTLETQEDIYIFLDDFHYLAMKEQPTFLDMVHSITRDCPIWIKAAAIKHQARWFTDNPPTGLQTGHDAALVTLDITLEQPGKAKKFLVSIIRTYAEEAKIPNITNVISPTAMERLVLASGGVPRDFLVLASTSIGVARERPKAKIVGVQDVNEAAGKIAQTKIQELEDDAASSIGKAKSRTEALIVIKKFLLEEQRCTYFRVDFQDKEQNAEEYESLQGLMDLRLIHLIHAGVSDERHAGQRSEVYMLDLSQFSGTRFRQNLRVLDLTKSYLVLKTTRVTTEPKKGDTSKKLLSILRRGPLFSLQGLANGK